MVSRGAGSVGGLFWGFRMFGCCVGGGVLGSEWSRGVGL